MGIKHITTHGRKNPEDQETEKNQNNKYLPYFITSISSKKIGNEENSK